MLAVIYWQQTVPYTFKAESFVPLEQGLLRDTFHLPIFKEYLSHGPNLPIKLLSELENPFLLG